MIHHLRASLSDQHTHWFTKFVMAHSRVGHYLQSCTGMTPNGVCLHLLPPPLAQCFQWFLLHNLTYCGINRFERKVNKYSKNEGGHILEITLLVSLYMHVYEREKHPNYLILKGFFSRIVPAILHTVSYPDWDLAVWYRDKPNPKEQEM